MQVDARELEIAVKLQTMGTSLANLLQVVVEPICHLVQAHVLYRLRVP